MQTRLFDYDLPPELIAQEPIEPRDAARMLVADGDAAPSHRHVRDLPSLLRRGDLLVVNRTKVFPARLFGHKATGGEIEVLLIHPEQDHGTQADASILWRALVRGRVHEDTELTFPGGLPKGSFATVLAVHDDGTRTVEFPPGTDVMALAERIGHVPLPPYIMRPDCAGDRDRYQTVFADAVGAVAAPTAGLHLTTELLACLSAMGVGLARVDLSIGPGTFKPVDTIEIEDFRIHSERCACPRETVDAITSCRAAGGRVIAVGTTVVRTLETAAAQPGGLAPFSGWTGIFLHPPSTLGAIDGLLTNFHLPRSSLLMLVSCLTGIERLHELYAIAIAERYRFFSYGDSMLVLKHA